MIELFGKDNIVNRLSRLHNDNKMPHAILLWGDTGVGKKTLARYCAGLFLENEIFSSKKIDRIYTDTHPDVSFVKSPAESDSKYTAELIRDVIKDSIVKPVDGDVKVYIFNDCDEMSVIQQNLLLKLIEEPPAFVRFIFTAQDITKILETIISRVVAFNVKSPSIKDCTDVLSKDTDLDENQCKLISESVNGNIGKALEIINNSEKNQIIEKGQEAVSSLISVNEYKFLSIISSFKKREDIWALLDYIIDEFRNALKLSVKNIDNNISVSYKIAEKFSIRKITSILELLIRLQKYREVNSNIALLSSYITNEIFIDISK